MRPTAQTWFFLRREPMYHKLQYSKVPKYDSSAAILGTVLGAFAGYLALATVGSGGTDLTDLTTLVTWCLVALGAIALSLEPRNHHTFVVCPPLALWVAPLVAVLPAVRGAAARRRRPSGDVRVKGRARRALGALGRASGLAALLRRWRGA